MSIPVQGGGSGRAYRVVCTRCGAATAWDEDLESVRQAWNAGELAPAWAALEREPAVAPASTEGCGGLRAAERESVGSVRA
jgi:hypothetical protein